MKSGDDLQKASEIIESILNDLIVARFTSEIFIETHRRDEKLEWISLIDDLVDDSKQNKTSAGGLLDFALQELREIDRRVNQTIQDAE